MTTGQQESPQSPKYPVVVPGVGPVPALGMIIGEAPGRSEIREGRPFVGRSGERLDTTLRLWHRRSEQFYITNVFKGDVGAGNRNPNWDEIRDHFPLLREEVAEVDPKAILLLGRFACSRFNINVSMRDAVGSYEVGMDRDFPELNGRYLVPCYHPAATMYDIKTLPQFQEQVGRFVELTQELVVIGDS